MRLRALQLTIRLLDSATYSLSNIISLSCLLVSVEEATTSMRKTSAVWLLKTREKHKIPLSVMTEITTDVEELFFDLLTL